MAIRKKKSRRRAKVVSDFEHQQLIADLTRVIDAWAKHAPTQKFGGMSLEQFRKAVQPSFDIDAEIAQIEWQLAQLQKQLDEEVEAPKAN
jgi:hypothetical protein